MLCCLCGGALVNRRQAGRRRRDGIAAVGGRQRTRGRQNSRQAAGGRPGRQAEQAGRQVVQAGRQDLCGSLPAGEWREPAPLQDSQAVQPNGRQNPAAGGGRTHPGGRSQWRRKARRAGGRQAAQWPQAGATQARWQAVRQVSCRHQAWHPC